MEMFIPVGVGLIINLVISGIAKILKQTNDTALLICIIAFFIAFVLSFIIGTWTGFGVLVLACGMLICIFIIKIVMLVIPHKD